MAFLGLCLQVTIIEKLVLGYESSLKSCRMFSESGECFWFVAIKCFFYHLIVYLMVSSTFSGQIVEPGNSRDKF